MAGITWGTFPGQTSTESDDLFVAKYDSSGKMIWLRQFGTDNNDYVYGIAADHSGVYVTGQTNGTFPGETNAGGIDAFIAKLKNSPGHALSGSDKEKMNGSDILMPPGLDKNKISYGLGQSSKEDLQRGTHPRGHKIIISIG